jgi:hypothetical protein
MAADPANQSNVRAKAATFVMHATLAVLTSSVSHTGRLSMMPKFDQPDEHSTLSQSSLGW